MLAAAMLVRKARPWSILLLAATCLSPVLSAQELGGAQSGVPVAPNGRGNNDAVPFGNNPNPNDPAQAHMLKDMMKDRNTLRQKQIVEDTNHLLDLAKQLKAAVDKSNSDQLSLSVVNTAAEIEKLAKTVKDKMRDGE
jgi:hypothetical protein